VGQDRIAEIKQALGPGDPDGHRRDGLGRGEDVPADVGYPMLFDGRLSVDGDVQALDTETPVAHSPDGRLDVPD
jgi:hypothetical protein